MSLHKYGYHIQNMSHTATVPPMNTGQSTVEQGIKLYIHFTLFPYAPEQTCLSHFAYTCPNALIR